MKLVKIFAGLVILILILAFLTQNTNIVTVDLNHQMAGHTLHFNVEVVAIREATSDERAHGHAHGPDNQHH